MSRLNRAAALARRVHKRDAVIVVLLLLNFVFTAQYVNRASAASASVTQLCEAGNAHDAKQVTFWEHVVAAFAPPRETPAQARQRLAADRLFLAYARSFFAPVNCQAPLTTRRQP